MKSLKEILAESKKTYSFKVGVAGELPEGFNERLKTALDKFSVASLSAGKKTPIQERPLDFPQLENTEVTYWDVEVNYPTTEQVLAEYLGNFCTVDKSKIVVRNPHGPVNMQQEEAKKADKETTYSPLLADPNLESSSAQNDVGESRIMELLKELEKARKERSDQSDFKVESPKESTENAKSVLGK